MDLQMASVVEGAGSASEAESDTVDEDEEDSEEVEGLDVNDFVDIDVDSGRESREEDKRAGVGRVLTS